MKKPKKEKIFKGCIKIPLSTDVTFNELLDRSTWYGDWINKRNIIFSIPRKWFVNTYVYHTQNNKITLETYKTSRVNSQDFKVVLDYIINQELIKYTDIDFTKSYLTVSC